MVQAIKRDEVYIEPEGIYVETHQPERRSRKPPLLCRAARTTRS